MSGILIGTDGACSGNPGPAGWAWVAQDGSAHGAAVPHGTNQMAELSAILLALQDFPSGPLTIQSDSAYAIGCSSTWKAGWQAKGYRRPSGELANLDVIRPIHQLLDTRGAPVDFVKVKGHDPGNRWPLNTAADALSVEVTAQTRRLGQPGDRRTTMPLPATGIAGPDLSKPAEQMVTLTAVKARAGWTDKAVATFLGDPDELRRNPKYSGAAPMKMFAVARIETVEASGEWQTWMAGRQPFKAELF